MADAEILSAADESSAYLDHTQDLDPAETAEWLDSLEYVLTARGPERARYLLQVLDERARRAGVEVPQAANTPYINTIPAEQPTGVIRAIVRWNGASRASSAGMRWRWSMRANKQTDGIGGHISTFASSATLYEVAFNHFFRGRGESGYDGDQVYFQGHASPGIYARAFLEGRLSEEHLSNFRRELAAGGGLSCRTRIPG